MMRNTRNRQGRGGEGVGGRHCNCCRSYASRKSYRTKENRQWRKDVTDAIV